MHMLPLSNWSRDRKLRRIGEQMKFVLSCTHPMLDCRCTLSGMIMELLTYWLGMRYQEVGQLVAECNRYMMDDEHRVYVNLHTFTARRP